MTDTTRAVGILALLFLCTMAAVYAIGSLIGAVVESL